MFTNLKRKYDKQEKQYRDDNQQLTSDFKHQLEQFRDVQKKAQSVLCFYTTTRQPVNIHTATRQAMNIHMFALRPDRLLVGQLIQLSQGFYSG